VCVLEVHATGSWIMCVLEVHATGSWIVRACNAWHWQLERWHVALAAGVNGVLCVLAVCSIGSWGCTWAVHGTGTK